MGAFCKTSLQHIWAILYFFTQHLATEDVGDIVGVGDPPTDHEKGNEYKYWIMDESWLNLYLKCSLLTEQLISGVNIWQCWLWLWWWLCREHWENWNSASLCLCSAQAWHPILLQSEALQIHIKSVTRVIERVSNGPSDVWTIPHAQDLALRCPVID